MGQDAHQRSGEDDARTVGDDIHQVADEIDIAVDIHQHHALPVVVGDLLQRTAEGHPCVAHEAVDVAFLFHLLGEVAHLLLVGLIDPEDLKVLADGAEPLAAWCN